MARFDRDTVLEILREQRDRARKYAEDCREVGDPEAAEKFESRAIGLSAAYYEIASLDLA
jgi:hypothetical protein